MEEVNTLIWEAITIAETLDHQLNKQGGHGATQVMQMQNGATVI